MTKRRRLLVHAARVATVATLVVFGCYTLCALGLGLFVTHRLTAEAAGRVRAALAHSAGLSLHPVPAPPGEVFSGNGDVDDAPIFFWYVPAHGRPEALTVGAPRLPRGGVGTGLFTRPIGASTFLFGSATRAGGVVVAGQSIAEVAQVRGALVLPGALLGLVIALATFVGSLLVALRASAPLEVVRRRQAEFTADASHELRTPLSVVEAEVDLALRRRRRPEEYEAVLRRIAGESRRLRRIVEDLLWLARADSGAAVHEQDEVADVGAVVSACVERFEAVATRDGVTLELRRAGQAAAAVRAPAELVDRLAGVLIDNACKYAGRQGTVSVAVTSTSGRVTLRVDDSGPGIPEEERGAIFDRFHRATAGGGGSGLGLAIADSVVQMTGGTWAVGDAPGGGARMEVSWRSAHEGDPPRAPRADADEVVVSSAAPQGRAVARGRSSALSAGSSRQPGWFLSRRSSW